jgi:hypothetical protein
VSIVGIEGQQAYRASQRASSSLRDHDRDEEKAGFARKKQG